MSQSSLSPVLPQTVQSHPVLPHPVLPVPDEGSSLETLQLRRLRFLQDFGHSLRTPLDSLLGLTNLTLETELLPQQREYLLLMRESCECLLRTVHTALDFASLETGTVSFATSVFDLKGLLGHSRNVLSLEARATGSELHVGLKSCIPERAVGDGPRLQELLTHMLKGVLTVCSGCTLHVLLEHAPRSDGTFLLRITLEMAAGSGDSGQLAALQAILKQGFDLTLDTYTPGRMHLALAQQLACGMGGSLSLSPTAQGGVSLKGEVLLGEAPATAGTAGTSEQVETTAPTSDSHSASPPEGSREPHPYTPQVLPVSTAQGTTGGSEPSSAAPTPPDTSQNPLHPPGASGVLTELDEPYDAQLRILVVEDNAVNRRLLLRLLEKQGYRVDGVESGEDALNRLKTEAYEVILMDLLLPGMDGMEAARQIRSRSWQGRVAPAIIALTAHTSLTLEKECHAVGMDGFLRKPIEAARLLALLRSIAGPLRDGLEAHRVRLAIDKTVLDRDELLTYFLFDLGLLARTARSFFLARHERLRALEEWARQGRWMPALHRAQGLRALLETFCAKASMEACKRLEAALARGSLEDSLAALTALERALDRLEPSMRALLRELQRAPLDPVGLEVA